MLPCVRGITFIDGVIDLSNPLEVVLSYPNPKLLARIANSVVDGLRGVGGVHDICSDHTPVIGAASLNAGVSPPAIRRKDGRRVVTVAADVDSAVISGDEANGTLANAILADLTAAYPNLTYTFGGEQQQQLGSQDAPYRGFAIALIMIVAPLATPLTQERAIPVRFPIHFAASLGCGILLVMAILMIVAHARCTIHLRLMACAAVLASVPRRGFRCKEAMADG